jgi:hypothetical protein
VLGKSLVSSGLPLQLTRIKLLSAGVIAVPLPQGVGQDFCIASVVTMIVFSFDSMYRIHQQHLVGQIVSFVLFRRRFYCRFGLTYLNNVNGVNC